MSQRPATDLDDASARLAAYQPLTEDLDLSGRRPSRIRYALSYLGRRPGLVLSIGWIAAVVLAAFAPSLFTSYSPYTVGIDIRTAPSWAHLFGTDEIGRDLFTRVVYGASQSLRASLIAVGVGLVAGAPIGLVAGYAGGWADGALMRLMDVVLAIPALLLALCIIIALGFGILNVAFAVGAVFVATSARLMRGEVLKIRQSPYVEAARAGGARGLRVLWRHVLPNSGEAILVLATIELGEAILFVSSLSFLGYGVQPPTPEWGALVSDGRDYLNSAWWLTTMPGLTIVATVLAANRISRAFGEVNR